MILLQVVGFAVVGGGERVRETQLPYLAGVALRYVVASALHVSRRSVALQVFILIGIRKGLEELPVLWGTRRHPYSVTKTSEARGVWRHHGARLYHRGEGSVLSGVRVISLVLYLPLSERIVAPALLIEEISVVHLELSFLVFVNLVLHGVVLGLFLDSPLIVCLKLLLPSLALSLLSDLHVENLLQCGSRLGV